MATEKQAEANRRNASHSTGPKTDEGKERSARNATTHGMTAKIVLPAEMEAATQTRYIEWAPTFLPRDPHHEYQLYQAVSASLRIEHCQQNETSRRIVLAEIATSTSHEWQDARTIEVACLGKTLKRDPEIVTLRLKQTVAGCAWLIVQWTNLLLAVPQTGDSAWSTAESNRVLDLLGEPKTLRDAMIASLAWFQDPVAIRSLIGSAIAELEVLQQGAEVRDERLRQNDVLGLNIAEDAKLKLIRRYETTAQRQYDRLIQSLGKPRRPSAPLRNEPNPQPTPTEPPCETKPNPAPRQPEPTRTQTKIRVDSAEQAPPAPRGNRLNRRKLQSKERHDAYLARIKA